MANAFDTDENCVSAFLFESGAFTDDSVGSASLATYASYGSPPVIDAVTYKEGSASAYQEQYQYDPFYVDNEPSDFPLHNASGEKTFSVVMWYRTPHSIDSNVTMFYKSQAFSVVYECFPGSVYFEFTVSVRDGVGWEDWNTGIELDTPDSWYHIAITYDEATGDCEVRIYDSDADSVITASHTFSKLPNDNGSDFYIGDYGSEDTSYIDEVAFFKDVLGADEIDEIRAGTYGAGGGPGEQGTGGSGGINTFLLGATF